MSPRLQNFITSQIFEVEALFKLFWKVYQKDNIDINRKSETPGNFSCPKGVEKSDLFSQETYHSLNFGYETLKSLLLKKTKCVPLTSFRVKFTNHQRYIFVVFTHQRMNDCTLMLLKDFREPLFSFELIHFRNFFCYRIENS